MKKRILNVGCGEDTYGTHFIDLYPTRENVIKCDVNMEKFPFKNNYFDEIIAIALFEHLTNPLNFLRECYRTLKSNGKLIIITDNAGFLEFSARFIMVIMKEFVMLKALLKIGIMHYSRLTT